MIQNKTKKNQEKQKTPVTKHVQHFKITPDFKKYFSEYCQEKRNQVLERITVLYDEVKSTTDIFQKQFPFFVNLSKEDAINLFMSPQPVDGGEIFIDATNKMNSRLQAFQTAMIEYNAYSNVLKDIENAETTETLYNLYNVPNEEKTFSERVLATERRLFSKAVNYANQNYRKANQNSKS